MIKPDLVEDIEQFAESNPEGLMGLITLGCNEVWGAVDEGRADLALLDQVHVTSKG